MPPLTFHPILKRARWGGVRLGTLLAKPIGEHRDDAESWEIADHGDDQSVVADGLFQGWPLRRLVRERGPELFGRQAGLERFPLLVKFLDATDRLSVQVHPDDEQARRLLLAAEREEMGTGSVEPAEPLVETGPSTVPVPISSQPPSGKTEAWVIIHAEPGARLYAGLKAGVDREGLRQHLADETVEQCLHGFPVSRGDCVFVPAGTVHAIGEGIVVAEIQQSSDLTFRLYDWGRVGADGKPRPLHIDEALACIDWQRGPVGPVAPRVISDDPNLVEELVHCPHFVLRRHTGGGEFLIEPDDRFHILMMLDGRAELTWEGGARRLALGQTVLVPATAKDVRIVPAEEIVVLETVRP